MNIERVATLDKSIIVLDISAGAGLVPLVLLIVVASKDTAHRMLLLLILILPLPPLSG